MTTDNEYTGVLVAGTAIGDITPKTSQFLYGYPFVERMSEGTHDPLLCSAMYLSDGKEQVLLISNDVIYVSKASVALIRKNICERTGVPAENILISVTHTHSGPITVDCMNSSNDPVVPKVDVEYVSSMEQLTIETACQAFLNAEPAKAGFLLADATGIGTNRHNPNGPADLNVPVVLLKNLKDEFIGCMLVCNMHPTILHEDSKLFSGDFPAFAREVLQQEYLNSKCPVVYFTGAAGNQSPRHVTKENTFEEAHRIGKIVADAIGKELSKGVEYSSEVPIKTYHKLVDIPRRTFPDVKWAKEHRDKSLELFESLKQTSKNAQEIRTAEVDWFGAEELLHLSKLSEEGKLEPLYHSCLPAEIQVIKIGTHNFVAWPGEIFIEYDLRLKEQLENTFLIALANGELQGYIATQEAVEKGFYEASNAIFHFSTGDVFVEETVKLIKEKL